MKRQMNLNLGGEIIIDLFAGGGGASIGIEEALGRPIDEAVNHDPIAIAMHKVNHPATRHWCEEIRDVDPLTVARGRPVGLIWASPDCKHLSKAKGKALADRRVRALAWIVLKWVTKLRPRILMLENVEEYRDWCPVRRGRPVKSKKSETFHRWVRQLRSLGYVVEYRELVACDYGAPTSRKRLYLIACRNGAPIVWPVPSRGPGPTPFRTAADVLDFSLPCPSIFMSKEQARAYYKATGVLVTRHIGLMPLTTM
jgi:DNA (cytosine-5)-methyltransferase 1